MEAKAWNELFKTKTYAGSNYSFHYVIANDSYYIPETLNEEMLIGVLSPLFIGERAIQPQA